MLNRSKNERGRTPRRHAQGLRRHPRVPCAAVLRKTFAVMEGCTDIKRLHVHGEKAAAYGRRLCARVGQACILRRAGDRRAESRGSSARRRGLHLRVIAMTGGRDPKTKFRKVYQEIDDVLVFEPVTSRTPWSTMWRAFPTWCGRHFASRPRARPAPCTRSSAAMKVRWMPTRRRWSRCASRSSRTCRRSSGAGRRQRDDGAQASAGIAVPGYRRRWRCARIRRGRRSGCAGRSAADPGRDLAQRQGRDPGQRSACGSVLLAPIGANSEWAGQWRRSRLLHRQRATAA